MWRTGPRILARRDDSYALIEPDGRVSSWFAPRRISVEDELWETTYGVVGEDLVETTTIERGPTIHVHKAQVVVRGLAVVEEEEPRRIAEAALVADDAARALERQQRALAADARVAAIPGSLDALGLGADAARAQRALCERIRAWDDLQAATLLRTLLVLARARPDAAVVAAYASACLHACFANDVPELAPSTPRTQHLELARTIAAHAHDLEIAADGQADVDARHNAIAFWHAAKALREASRLLA